MTEVNEVTVSPKTLSTVARLGRLKCTYSGIETTTIVQMHLSDTISDLYMGEYAQSWLL